MIDSTAVSSVRAVDHRSAVTNTIKKTPGSTEPVGKAVSGTREPPKQDVKINTDEDPHGALAKLRESMREFTFGVLRPKTGLVGEKTYETSFSQTMENLSKEYNGALAGFHNKIHGFAFGILRPETGVIGETIFDSSHSITMDNLSKKHVGAAAGIQQTLRQYANAAMESTGALVPITESTQVFEQEFQDISAAGATDVPQDTQRVDTTI